MREVIISFEGYNCIHSIFGIIKDPSFSGGDINFSCHGYDKLGYDFFFSNDMDCMGFSEEKLPDNLKDFLLGINFKGF